MAKTQLSTVGEIVRRHDPDRFFTALFAPAAHRDTLFTLYAFNHELARASEVAREPIAALIRLQWWREVVEGARRRHEVAGPLGEALDSGRLLAADLIGMVDGREAEVEPIPDDPSFLQYIEATAGGVSVAAARALGMEDAEPVRGLGAAYGISGLLRGAGRRGAAKSLLPVDGASPEALRTLALSWIDQATPVRRQVLAAVLPAALARSRLRSAGSEALARFSVVRAAVLGRL